MHTMKIEANETAKAFRINGVTLAKRHLRDLFAGDDIQDNTRLGMFLATVPDTYITGAAEFMIEHAKPKSSVYYAAKKVLRLWAALKLTPGIAKPFQMFALELGGADVIQKHVARRVREAVKDNPGLAKHFNLGTPPRAETGGDNVIQFPGKPTVH